MNSKQQPATRLQGARGHLLTEVEAAAILNLTRRALQAWRYQGRGPRFVKISARAVRYRPEDLDAWIESKLRTSTSDGGYP